MEITLPRALLRRVLFAAMAVVVGAGLGVEILKATVRLGEYRWIVPLFSLSYEQNIPTWYSSALLLSCSALLALIAAGTRRANAPFVRHWWGLSAAFLYISLDETAQIHEHAGFLKLHGVLYFSWVIPAGVLVAAIGLAYLRFLAHLPPRVRWRFVIAGAIYVSGALFMELPLGYWTEREGDRNFVYAAIDAVEEGMEILGATLFLLALAEYIGARGFKAGMEAPPPEKVEEEKETASAAEADAPEPAQEP